MKIIKFYADWCMPCKALTPIFDEISQMEEFKDVEFHSMNIEDENAFELVQKYKIQAVPSIVILNDDDSLNKKIIGMLPKSDLLSTLKKECNV